MLVRRRREPDEFNYKALFFCAGPSFHRSIPVSIPSLLPSPIPVAAPSSPTARFFRAVLLCHNLPRRALLLSLPHGPPSIPFPSASSHHNHHHTLEDARAIENSKRARWPSAKKKESGRRMRLLAPSPMWCVCVCFFFLCAYFFRWEPFVVNFIFLSFVCRFAVLGTDHFLPLCSARRRCECPSRRRMQKDKNDMRARTLFLSEASSDHPRRDAQRVLLLHSVQLCFGCDGRAHGAETEHSVRKDVLCECVHVRVCKKSERARRKKKRTS